jgi:hypothetical protein
MGSAPAQLFGPRESELNLPSENQSLGDPSTVRRVEYTKLSQLPVRATESAVEEIAEPLRRSLPQADRNEPPSCAKEATKHAEHATARPVVCHEN